MWENRNVAWHCADKKHSLIRTHAWMKEAQHVYWNMSFGMHADYWSVVFWIFVRSDNWKAKALCDWRFVFYKLEGVNCGVNVPENWTLVSVAGVCSNVFLVVPCAMASVNPLSLNFSRMKITQGYIYYMDALLEGSEQQDFKLLLTHLNICQSMEWSVFMRLAGQLGVSKLKKMGHHKCEKCQTLHDGTNHQAFPVYTTVMTLAIFHGHNCIRQV